MPKDKVTGAHQGYAFVEMVSEEDADYLIRILNNVKFFGKLLRINKVPTTTHHARTRYPCSLHTARPTWPTFATRAGPSHV